MKMWRLIVTDTATWHGKAEEFELRWQAELAYEAASGPGKIATLAEIIDGRQTEIVKDTRFESHKEMR